MTSFTKPATLALTMGAAFICTELNADPCEDALDVIHDMVSALGNGQVAPVVNSYSDDGLLVLNNTDFRGPDMLTAAYTEFAAISPEIRFDYEDLHITGNIALHIAPWSMTGTAPDGTAVTDSGLSVVVLQKQDDGEWKILMDLPHANHAPR
ncbi:YybH family protein [Halocynthiibacter sp.]|uniref:YybH family protein n=1 Tax=Halocynthiibacter sp. TaxID=1979210 RepID=UPI003C5E2AA3